MPNELVQRSIDEVTNDLLAVYEADIAPKRIFRSTNNKLFLIFRGMAAGIVKINDAILALKNRFDPLYCSDSDLETTFRLMGIELNQGSASLIEINIINTSVDLPVTLAPGLYRFTSATGTFFNFNLSTAIELTPLEQFTLNATSQFVGPFSVSAVTDANIIRVDGAVIPAAIQFNILNNQYLLGHLAETLFEARQRVLSYDLPALASQELRDKLRSEPNVFDADVIMNSTNTTATIEGYELSPFQMLILISGIPGDRVGEIIAKSGMFNTKMVDPLDVVYYYDDTLLNGQHASYWVPFTIVDYTMNVVYQYDSNATDDAKVETALDIVFNQLKFSNRRSRFLTPSDIVNLATGNTPTGARVLTASFTVDAAPVVIVSPGRTEIARLTTLTYTAINVTG